MFYSEALTSLDIISVVSDCCLMKIHVQLKKDHCPSGKSLGDYGGNRWGAWSRRGQQFWRRRQSDNVVEHLFVLRVIVDATL